MTESSKYKNSKPRVFLFFLLLSFIFWMLARSTRQNSTRLDVGLDYNNVPENSIVGQQAPESLEVELKTTGFQYLIYKIKPPRLSINLALYASAEDTLVMIGKDEVRQMIVSELSQEGELRYLTGDDLMIPLDKIVRRRLAVQADLQLDYEQGFSPVGDAVIVPDSITLTGPRHLIDSIKSISTQPIQGESVATDLLVETQLILPEGVQNDLDSETVSVQLKVSEFIRKEVQLTPQIINLPEETQIRLIPETITLSFDVSVDQFNSVGPDAFEVVCDFSQRNNEENFMIPRIISHPDHLQRVELQDKKIDYLIFK